MDVLFITIGIIVLFFSYALYSGRKEEKAKKQRMQNRIERDKRLKEEHNIQLEKLTQKFGSPVTVDINYANGKYFSMFEQSRKLIINDQELDFTDLLSYQIRDNSTVVQSASVAKTTTDSSNMLGRVIIGGMVGGETGAIIGAATANKTTTITESTSYTKHDYRIIIFIKILSAKPIEMRIGKDQRITDQIANVLSVILEANKQV